MGAISVIRTNIAQIGPGATLLYALKRALEASGCGVELIFYRLVAQKVPEGPLLSGRRGASVEVREAGPDDPALEGLPLTRAVIEARFAQGARCLVALRDGRSVGCLWLCLDAYDEDAVRARFLPQPPGGSAWDFDVYVEPAQRGGVVFAKLWDAYFARLRALGRRWSLSRISAFNPDSSLGHGRLGAVAVGRMLVIFGKRRQLTLATLPPFLNVSSGPDSAPVFRVAPPAD